MGDDQANAVLTQAEAVRVRVQLSTIFNPTGPIARRDLFSGRRDAVARVLSAVGRAGQHVILFGERGVGKTSLASLAHEFWADFARETSGCVAVRYNCEPSDSFATIWARIAELLSDEYARQNRALPTNETWRDLFEEITHEAGAPHSVRRFLDLANEMSIIVIDEFDQVDDEDAIQQFASLIKALSDHLTPSTLILVGVADTVDDLIEDHASIDRAANQVALPRMSRQELEEIIQSRYDRIGLSADPGLVSRMAALAQGLPHYAHRLGQEAGLSAVDRDRLNVDERDVARAIEMAIEHTQASIGIEYRKATASPRRDALFGNVLLACAMVPGDDLGFFASSDIRGPLQRLTGKAYDFPQFARHLNQFSSPVRGNVLEVVGPQGRRRYRFTNPLLRPYVVLRGIHEGALAMSDLSDFGLDSDEPRLL